MHKSVLIENVSIIKKQRNMFLVTSGILLISNMLMSIKVATADQKIVLVPALKSEMMVSKEGVSKSYLEEMSLLFISNLLDLSPSDIEHKRELVLKYSSNSNPKALERLVEYFSKCALDYKRFSLTTYFSVKNLEIDLDKLTVIAHGMLTSYYGKAGHESEKEDYLLEFEWQGGNLRLKSFARIMDEEKRARDKAKSLKYEEDEKDISNNSLLNSDDNHSKQNLQMRGINEHEDGDDDEGEPQ